MCARKWGSALPASREAGHDRTARSVNGRSAVQRVSHGGRCHSDVRGCSRPHGAGGRSARVLGRSRGRPGPRRDLPRCAGTRRHGQPERLDDDQRSRRRGASSFCTRGCRCLISRHGSLVGVGLERHRQRGAQAPGLHARSVGRQPVRGRLLHQRGRHPDGRLRGEMERQRVVRARLERRRKRGAQPRRRDPGGFRRRPVRGRGLHECRGHRRSRLRGEMERQRMVRIGFQRLRQRGAQRDRSGI